MTAIQDPVDTFDEAIADTRSSNPKRKKANPVLKTRRGLPSGRAVLGGLLISLSILGVLFALQLGEDATFRDVVVAREDLAPGTILEAQHLAQITVRLDESATFVAAESNALIGQVVLGPVGRLEFMQASNVAPASGIDAQGGLAVVSLAIDPNRAPFSLAAGEIVSVLATFDDADPAVTELIADRVMVLSYDTGNGDFGTNDAVLRLGIAQGELASAIVNASQTGEISIIGLTSAPSVELPERHS